MNAMLLMALLAASDGDPPATTLSLAVANPARSDAGRVSFDLQVRWPAGATGAAAAAPKCTMALTLPDGTTPAVETKGAVPGADGYTTHVEYTAKEAAGPSVWKLAVKCPGIDSGAPQSFGVFGTPPNAHLVIAFGAKSRAEADAWLAAHDAFKGVPTHNQFPVVVESDWVLGLKPGFFIVVVAAADDKGVADQLAKEINAHDIKGVYVKPAWWPAPEPLRLLIVDAVVDANKIVPSSDRNEIFILQDATPREEQVRGRSTVWSDERAALVLVSSPKGGPTYELAVSAPQTSCNVVSPAKLTFDDKRLQRIKKVKLECVQGD